MSVRLDRTSAKILVLGDSGVGKSSLIHLICHSATLSSAHWTIGCSIDVKLFGNCFLEFWDIGGSRSHKIARSFLYQDYHGIMLVFDATNNKSRLNLNEWLMEVAQKTNDKDLDNHVNVPIITIGTKKDQLPYRTLMEIENESSDYNDISVGDMNSSVVNFDYSPRTSTASNYPYRRLNMAGGAENNSFLSSLNTSIRSSATSSSLNEPAVSPHRTVIYVDTQDVLSFRPGSRDCEKLTNFFKTVVERRNKRFSNKFAI